MCRGFAFRHCSATALLAACACLLSVLITATPVSAADDNVWDGEWSGKYSSTCDAHGTLKMTIRDGDIDGEMVVRGTGELDGIHPLKGYIDRKGRIAEGITNGIMIARVLGQFSPTNAKGQIKVPDCQANWKMTRLSDPGRQQNAEVEPPRPITETTTTSAARDVDAPVIALPGELLTDGPLVTVIGAISDASGVTQVQIDGETLALGQSGVVNLQRAVPVGISEITVSAVDEWGNRSEQRVRVIRRAASVDANNGRADLRAEDLDLGNFVALVIGNNDYGVMPDLNTAVDDARAVANILKSNYGFTVRTLENATRYDILGAMSEMRASLRYDDNLLIYYAGHGIVDAVTERGYWLPVDADESNPANWISNADITDQLKAMPARHVLVIADSCYSGTLTRASAAELDTWEDRRAWLERVSGKRSRTAFSSGGLEPVNDAGGGRHSVFASALLDALATNEQIVDAQSLFDPVRKRVVLNADQTPQYSDVRLAGHEGGDFVFVPQ
jgi:uncharacterized caspase-like protein